MLKLDLTHVTGVRVTPPHEVSDCVMEYGRDACPACPDPGNRCKKLVGGKIVFTRHIDLDHDSVEVAFDCHDPFGKGFKFEVEEV